MSIFLVTKKGVTQLPLHFWDTLSHLSYLMLPPANVENGQPRTSVKQANNPKYYQLIENTKMLKDIPCFVFFLLHRLFSKAPEVDLPREWILMSPCPITTASLFSNLILPVLTWKHCTCYKLFKKQTNTHTNKKSSWLLALHPHCISFDPRLWLKHLDGSDSNVRKLFEFVPCPKTPLLSLGLHYAIKGDGVHWQGFASRNVWLSVCVLVAWTCTPHISHHHRKWPAVCFEVPADFFIIPTISGDTRRQPPLPLSPSPLLTHPLCTHPLLLLTQSCATKCLIECRTSVY